MTLKEANIKIKQLDNDILYLDQKKELEFQKTQPGASKSDKEIVDGIQFIDKNINYVIAAEEITRTISIKRKEKENLENWVNRELKTIGEYEPLKAKIIKLRDEKGYTWESIAEATNYSRIQCIRIYKEYSEERLSDIIEASKYIEKN